MKPKVPTSTREIEAVLDKHPLLHLHGYGPKSVLGDTDEADLITRYWLLRAREVEAVEAARAWLRRNPKVGGKGLTSYGTKAKVEHEVGGYISNGACIVAMLLEGRAKTPVREYNPLLVRVKTKKAA